MNECDSVHQKCYYLAIEKGGKCNMLASLCSVIVFMYSEMLSESN